MRGRGWSLFEMAGSIPAAFAEFGKAPVAGFDVAEAGSAASACVPGVAGLEFGCDPDGVCGAATEGVGAGGTFATVLAAWAVFKRSRSVSIPSLLTSWVSSPVLVLGAWISSTSVFRWLEAQPETAETNTNAWTAQRTARRRRRLVPTHRRGRNVGGVDGGWGDMGLMN